MSIEAMKVEGPLHVVCQCDKCKDKQEQGEPDYKTLAIQLQQQRTWVGLTRDEILEARWHNKSSYKFARVLEDKLKEKNT